MGKLPAATRGADLTQIDTQIGREVESFGRQDELARIGAVIDDARRGTTRALVLRGEPGMGKTTLLRDAVQMATGFTVLRVDAGQRETGLEYAAVHQLCAPLLSRLSRLPAPGATALELAFGLRAGVAPDRAAVHTALLDLIADAAPVLCVIDDAQWLDSSSATAMTYVVQRNSQHPIAVLAATRSTACDDLLRSLPSLQLTGLAPWYSTAVLDRHLHVPIDTRVRETIVAEARGNPEALLQLPRGATPASIAGGFGLPAAVRSSAGGEFDHGARLAGLSPSARSVVLLAATDPTGDPAVLHISARQLGVDVASVMAEVAPALITIGSHVLFHHPLERSALYWSATEAERRHAHTALAAAHTAGHWRLWHRSQATVGPDDSLSLRLEHAARDVAAEGGVAATAVFLQAALRLSTDCSRRYDLTLRAATAKRDAGDADTALALISSADRGSSTDGQRAHADLLRAQIAFDHAPDAEHAELLWDAAHRFEDPEPAFARVARLRAAIVLAVTDPDVSAGLPASCRSAADEVFAADLALHALSYARANGRAAAVPAARAAVSAYLHSDVDDRDTDLESAWLMCSLAWDAQSWQTISERHLAQLRGMGMLAELPRALDCAALGHILAGELRRAADTTREAQAVRTVIGKRPLHQIEMILAALHGNASLVDALATRLTTPHERHHEKTALPSVTYARMVLANGSCQYRTALQAIEAAQRVDTIGHHVLIPLELVEAAVYGGRPRVAQTAVVSLTEEAGAAGTSWASGIERLCRALVADHGSTETLFIESIEHLSKSTTPFYLARSHLLYGEWLRRDRQRAKARAQLQRAHQIFADLECEGFAARALRELRATGESSRRPAGRDQLTAHETAIAERAAQGATSKEIASELLISHRTVDAHLRNIFAKLDVTSRREIQGALDRRVG